MECPKRHAKLQWSYPTPALMRKAKFNKQGGLLKAGNIISCGCIIEDKNYCLMCGALVWESKVEP